MSIPKELTNVSGGECARYRRTRMVNHAAYQANVFLAKALKKISKEKFDKMIVYLG